MKRGAPDHPKMFALAEALGVRRPMAVGLIEMLIHFTARYAPEGDVGRYNDKRIAAGMDWGGSSQKLIDALVATGWLDRDQVARLVVHHWADHADKTTLQRLSRHGKKALQGQDTDDPAADAAPGSTRPAGVQRPSSNGPTRLQRPDSGVPTGVKQPSSDGPTGVQRPSDSVLTQNAALPNQQDTAELCAQSEVHRARGLASAKPAPVPEPAPSQRRPNAAHETSLAGSLAGFPLTAFSVRKAFPATEDRFVVKLVAAVVEKIGTLNESVREQASDAVMADAVRQCHEKNQKTAGLFLRTVPQCVATWLTQGRPHEDRARLPLSENSLKAIEFEEAINRRLRKC
jgi:hypothetical protein